MPVKRTQLSRLQRARYLEDAQELQAAGLGCEIPRELEEDSRSLDIWVASWEGNILCELSSGITACAIWVKMVALGSLHLILEDFSIRIGGDSELTAVPTDGTGLCRVKNAIDFTEDQTLNRRIENGLHFCRPGDAVEGWVVATGYWAIPDKYREGAITDLRPTFTDQFGHDHSVQAQAALQRGARLRHFARVQKSPSQWPAEKGLDGRENLERVAGVPITKLASRDVGGTPVRRGQS